MKKLIFLVFIALIISCTKSAGTYNSNHNSEEFPDTIMVALIIDGEFVDSCKAVNVGPIENDSAPNYQVMDAVGHAWLYDVNGQFIRFIKSNKPHSDCAKCSDNC